MLLYNFVPVPLLTQANTTFSNLLKDVHQCISLVCDHWSVQELTALHFSWTSQWSIVSLPGAEGCAHNLECRQSNQTRNIRFMCKYRGLIYGLVYLQSPLIGTIHKSITVMAEECRAVSFKKYRGLILFCEECATQTKWDVSVRWYSLKRCLSYKLKLLRDAAPQRKKIVPGRFYSGCILYNMLFITGWTVQ